MLLGITLNDIVTGFAVLIGLINAVVLYVRIGHHVRLRQAELAMRIVEVEYRRKPELYANMPSYQLLELCLPIIEDVYRHGSFDVRSVAEAWCKRLREVTSERQGEH